ncbi:unnamed protein product, partial [Prorocentrum cordatum]
ARHPISPQHRAQDGLPARTATQGHGGIGVDQRRDADGDGHREGGKGHGQAVRAGGSDTSGKGRPGPPSFVHRARRVQIPLGVSGDPAERGSIAPVGAHLLHEARIRSERDGTWLDDQTLPTAQVLQRGVYADPVRDLGRPDNSQGGHRGGGGDEQFGDRAGNGELPRAPETAGTEASRQGQEDRQGRQETLWTQHASHWEDRLAALRERVLL